MKIFSLETKKHLVGWSLVISFVINFILHFFSRPGCPFTVTQCSNDAIQTSWPFSYVIYDPIFDTIFDNSQREPDLVVVTANLIFWILIVLIILSFIRHFRKKQNEVPSKVGL